MKHTLGAVLVFAVLSLVSVAFAQDAVKDAGKDTEKATTKAAKTTAHATDKAAVKTADTSKDAAKVSSRRYVEASVKPTSVNDATRQYATRKSARARRSPRGWKYEVTSTNIRIVAQLTTPNSPCCW